MARCLNIRNTNFQSRFFLLLATSIDFNESLVPSGIEKAVSIDKSCTITERSDEYIGILDRIDKIFIYTFQMTPDNVFTTNHV